LRVRFGEVESRGVALTPAGRDRYDAMLREVDVRVAAGSTRAAAAADVWREQLPATELGLLRDGLAYFTFEATGRPHTGGGVVEQVESGALRATPIVYEDFLPRSAAGIFQSNLTAEGRRADGVAGTRRDAGWLSDVIGAEVGDPFALYAAQQQASLDAVLPILV
jgi:uncharacterized glyoxalase superfamily metalloenzyme YdcJ